MSWLEAIVLGIVQGITEFLPISSTAHLRIAPELFGWGDPGAAFSAVIQLGTVAAVIIYFAKDVLRMAGAFFDSILRRSPFQTPDSRLAWFVVIGTIPVGVAGLLFKKSIETSLRSLYVIALAMIILALVLFAAERLASHRRGLDQMTLADGILIGICQAFALIPGSSRSGTTLTGALAVGLRREDAARYSFLLSIPATTAAGLFELRHFVRASAGEHPAAGPLILGTLVSFGAGILAIAGLLRFLRTHTTTVFVVYRVLLGSLLLVLLGKGILQPTSGAELEHKVASVQGRPLAK
ncbi:MAG TPA: undecaprenyl-diphosphate phosphatase [Myxococcaceae bacterium]|nr:undecaprenyl-diphosphate phosphatase [Myxococcaceae bacterium]